MLIGKYEQTIDAKGRVNIPSKFRADLGDSFVVTRGMDGCISIYPMEEWERFETALNEIPSSKRRDLQRYFCSAAEVCSIDAQGRTLIRADFRNEVAIKKDVVVVGVSRKLEIWAKEKWNDYMQKPDFEPDAITNIMEEFGL